MERNALEGLVEVLLCLLIQVLSLVLIRCAFSKVTLDNLDVFITVLINPLLYPAYDSSAYSYSVNVDNPSIFFTYEVLD